MSITTSDEVEEHRFERLVATTVIVSEPTGKEFVSHGPVPENCNIPLR